ncbi:hypothetical protein [Lysinibacter sp. HNR]|uniref:hypothetical protein n=1 Tax=Lysinibacter sp. HNR TaxID=3031408 RepID=UPI00243521F5|nr:hypothetical protein [Lysinibacter sp. HNR]WGD37965.1 hypothetical protein FrondiHNR_03350 [Lysinibacter sp. HNR]
MGISRRSLISYSAADAFAAGVGLTQPATAAGAKPLTGVNPTTIGWIKNAWYRSQVPEIYNTPPPRLSTATTW